MELDMSVIQKVVDSSVARSTDEMAKMIAERFQKICEEKGLLENALLELLKGPDQTKIVAFYCLEKAEADDTLSLEAATNFTIFKISNMPAKIRKKQA